MTIPESNEAQSYLDLGRLGKSAWWRYLVGFLLIILSYVIVSVACFCVLQAAAGGNLHMDRSTGKITGTAPLTVFIVQLAMFIPLLAGIWLVVRQIHKRPFLSLITPNTSLNLRRVFFGFAIWGVLEVISTLICWLARPQAYQISFRAPEFFYFLAAALLLTPTQCLVEELISRGYTLQALSSVIRNRWLLSAVCGLVFMLPHLSNPELLHSYLLIFYMLYIGFVLAMITIRTNGLELALGSHIAHNLYSMLVVGDVNFPIATNSIFISKAGSSYGIIASAISTLIFYLLAVRLFGNNSASARSLLISTEKNPPRA